MTTVTRSKSVLPLHMAPGAILPPIAHEGSFSLKLTSPPRELTRNRFDINEDYLASPTPLSMKLKEMFPLDRSVLFPSVVRTPPLPYPSTHRTKKHSSFDTGPQPDSNLATFESAGPPHVVHTDEPLVGEIEAIMDDVLARIAELIREREASRFQEGYQYALQSILNTCTSYVDDHANNQIDAGVIPLTLRDYMSMLLGHKTEERKYPDKWTSPPFD